MSPRHGYDAHGDWDALAAGHALSALDPEDEGRFLTHLGGCDRCLAAVAEATRTVGDLAYAVPREAPPAELGARLMAALAAESGRDGPTASTRPAHRQAVPPRHPPATPTSRLAAAPRRPSGGRHAAPDHVPDHAAAPAEAAQVRRGPSRRWSAAVAAAAALVLLGGLGWWNLRLRAEQDQLRSTVAQRESVIEQLTRQGRARVAALSADADPKGRRLATIVIRTDGIDVITESLTPNDAATTKYWLWSLTSLTDTSPKPIAGFDVSTSALSVRTLRTSTRGLDKIPIFAVSREPSLAKPTRPTVVVAAGQAQ
jgi:Anti-sigma-K factor rskA, C-terminal